MKPCRSCISDYGKALCTHLGCCAFDEVYENPPNEEGWAKTHMAPPPHPLEDGMEIVKPEKDP